MHPITMLLLGIIFLLGTVALAGMFFDMVCWCDWPDNLVGVCVGLLLALAGLLSVGGIIGGIVGLVAM